MLVKLFGRPADEQREFSDQSATVRDLGVQIAMVGRIFYSALALVAALATALVYGVGGQLAISGTVTVGTLLALAALMGRLYGPLTAVVQRPGRHDDRAGLLRACLRGARPRADDQRGRRRSSLDRAAGDGRVRPRRVPLPDRRRGVIGEPRDRRDPGGRVTTEVLHDVRSRSSRARWSRSWGPPARARRRSPTSWPGCTTSTDGAVSDRRRRRPRSAPASRCTTWSATSPRTPTCSTTAIRANLLYARPDATDGRARSRRCGPHRWGSGRVAARRARHRRRGPRLPAQRWRAAAARDRPAAAQGSAHHRARRGDRTPRQRVRGRGPASARHRARGPHLAGDRPPLVDRAQRRPDLRGRRGS